MESNSESPVFSYGVGEIMAENKHHRKRELEEETYRKNNEAMKRVLERSVKKRGGVKAKENTAMRDTREDLTEMLLEVMESDSESPVFSYGVGEIMEENNRKRKLVDVNNKKVREEGMRRLASKRSDIGG